MGMDSVELVMGFEEAFALDIPDDTASEMITPRDTIDYLASRLPTIPATRCVTQQTLYRIRRGLGSALSSGGDIRPTTSIRDLVAKGEWPVLWERIRDLTGTPDWPAVVPRKGWLSDGPETLRELTVHVAMHLPSPDPRKGEPWTREQVELTVRRVIWDTIGVKGFGIDDQYVRDMGVT